MSIDIPSNLAENPMIRLQLLYNHAEQDRDCFMVKTWTTEQLDDWERSGYRTQDGHYTEIGLFDTEDELEKEKRKIIKSRELEL